MSDQPTHGSATFGAQPTPKSVNGYHRVLSPNAGIRVSPLCLGAMNFGDNWQGFMGKCDKDTTYSMLDYFVESGGNFIDTANNYQGEESEKWIGDWMQERKIRDQIVLATKYTTYFPSGFNHEKLTTNFTGNSSKSMKTSVDASLRKLKTDYIDLLYLHWWDFSTSIPEVMQSLNQLVQSGKVLYLGVSDTPAWVVSKANEYARNHGLRGFSVYQGQWSAAERDFERDIIPMCRDEGMALCPWGALGGGKFKTEEQKAGAEGQEGRKMGEADDKYKAVTAKLDKVAKKHKSIITSVALAYVMQKTPYVFPIVGGRKVDHLKGNVEALKLQLQDEDIKEIESAYDFDIGFPMKFLFGFGVDQKYDTNMTYKDVGLLKFGGHLDSVEPVKAVKPRKD